MELGERIQKVLDEKGLTQADLCRMSHLCSARVSAIVSGSTKDPRLSTVLPIAKALGMSLDELAAGSTRPQNLSDDGWQDRLDLNYRMLNKAGRMRLVEESEILMRSGMFGKKR